MIQLELRQRPLNHHTQPHQHSRRSIYGLTLFVLGWMAYHWVWQPTWIIQLSDLSYEFLILLEGAALFTISGLWGFLAWRDHQQQSLTPRPTIQSTNHISISREQLYELSPYQFESYVAELFRRKGYSVTMRGGSGDHGVDLELIDRNGRSAIVQCKRYQRPIGPDVVRELFGTTIHERAGRGFLVTTADISSMSRRWAKGKPLSLIDGEALTKLAQQVELDPLEWH